VQWVPDTAPGAVIKIENANQFAPVTCDPKELRSKFHEVQMTYNYIVIGNANSLELIMVLLKFLW